MSVEDFLMSRFKELKHLQQKSPDGFSGSRLPQVIFVRKSVLNVEAVLAWQECGGGDDLSQT